MGRFGVVSVFFVFLCRVCLENEFIRVKGRISDGVLIILFGYLEGVV